MMRFKEMGASRSHGRRDIWRYGVGPNPPHPNLCSETQQLTQTHDRACSVAGCVHDGLRGIPGTLESKMARPALKIRKLHVPSGSSPVGSFGPNGLILDILRPQQWDGFPPFPVPGPSSPYESMVRTFMEENSELK